MTKKDQLVVFESNNIRRIWHQDEWWFSVVDVCKVLVESGDPGAYWRKLKQRLKEEGSEVVTFCHGLKIQAPDGKMRESDCANTESMFRIIQSIPSPKAEPFKQWLAQVGYERIEEIQDPEMGQDRIKNYYEMKGYPKEWIDVRLRGIAVRQELTDEWKQRSVGEKREFAILTDEISKATFGKTTKQYKEFKQLQRKQQNLRDSMTNLELIFTMLGEASTTEVARSRDAQGFVENKGAAKTGGGIAGSARKNLEKETGKKVVSKKNYIHLQKHKSLK